MAEVIGGVTSSHIPAVGNAIANNLQQEPYWKRFFDGYGPAKDWLQKHQPDVAHGFVNPIRGLYGTNVDFDLETMDRIASDPEWFASCSNSEIMRRAGTEGIETIYKLIICGQALLRRPSSGLAGCAGSPP